MLTSSSWIGSMIPCFPLDILLVSESVLLIFWSSSKLPNPFSSFLVPSSVSSASKRIRAIYKWSLVWVYKDHRKQKTRKTLFRPVTSYHHFWNLSLLNMKKKFQKFLLLKKLKVTNKDLDLWQKLHKTRSSGVIVMNFNSFHLSFDQPTWVFFFFTEHRKIHHLIYIIWHTHNYVFCNKH